MNLKKKKELAAKALGVGKNRISFNPEGLNEIKEAITKQDIHSLHEEGVITIKPIKGRRKIEKRSRRRGSGKIKMKVRHRKQDYVKITRKLRKYLKDGFYFSLWFTTSEFALRTSRVEMAGIEPACKIEPSSNLHI